MTVAASSAEGQGSIAQAAQIWAEKGFSVVPIRADGTKKPSSRWKIAQSQVSPGIWARRYFTNNPSEGIGIVCGKVSGNLEMTELEGRATSAEVMERIFDRFEDFDQDNWAALNLMWTAGYVEITPSGGVHLLYRIADHEVPGNTKIARRPATEQELADKPDDRIKVLAETRGEGGYVIVAPTGGTVHPSGLSWEVQAGQIGEVPTITWAQRNLLHAALHAVLDEMPKEAPREQIRPVAQHSARAGTRPGDAFNEQANWADILEPAGWTYSHSQGNTVYWVRPGKSKRDGHSATTGHAGTGAADRLYVMSSATEFDMDQPHSKFFVYAHYHHGGDLAAATRELARQGYGEQLRPSVPQGHPAWEDWGAGLPDTPSNVDSPKSGPSPSKPFSLAKPKGVTDYTQAGAVVRFILEWGRYIRYVTEEKSWRVWNGVLWEADLTGASVSRCFEAMTEKMLDEAKAMAEDDPIKKPFTAHVRRLRDSGRTAIMSLIASHVTCSASEFDADPRYLNLQNGVYDMVDDAFLPHDTKYMLTKVAGFSYDEDAKAPKSEVFLGDLLPSEQMREFTLQALAYSMTGEADRKAMFVLQGIPNSGKTQITEMAARLFGDYAVSVSPGTFTKRREHGPNPELHNMRGARFVYTSETSYEIQLDEELVKRITGKDTMSTRTLYERPQQWVPQCTVWIATNNLPRFGSDSDAMWKRVKTVRFVNEFSDDGSSGHVAQPNIGRSLASEEAAGLFNLLLGALRRYRVAGRLAEPQELRDSVSAHREEVDPLIQWVQAMKETGRLVADEANEASQTAMRKAYVTFCDDQGHTALGAQRFGNAVTAILKCTKRRSNGDTLIKGWRFVAMGTGWITGWRDHRELDQTS